STSSSPTCRRPPSGANGCSGSKPPSSPSRILSRAKRFVGQDCRFDGLIADIIQELRGRPYDLVQVAGGYALAPNSASRPRSAPSIPAGCRTTASPTSLG